MSLGSDFSTRLLIEKRAKMLASVRAFFASRDILEVDCPALSSFACVDAHIDVFFTGSGYLHTSPEYGMKRLLAEGSGDIYQLSHVFRAEERGRYHRPEFMMAEWYRIGMAYEAFIEETLEFIRLFLGNLPVRYVSYKAALQDYAGIDYLHTPTEVLQERAGRWDWKRDELLDYILTTDVEPHFGKEAVFVLTDYPASCAALAKTYHKNGEHVAKRFEIYHGGIELANGYHELTDPIEQRMRLEKANKARELMGKAPLPIDELFLAALEKGLPDCCGVACGIDRLFLLQLGGLRLEEVLPLEP